MSRVDEPHEDVRMHLTSPVIEPGHTFASVTDKISALTLKRRTPLGWYIGFALSFMLLQMLLFTITYLSWNSYWGNKSPSAGLSTSSTCLVDRHRQPGTLISAIMLFSQEWRNSIPVRRSDDRFAVACADYLHASYGRPWLAYWMFLPNRWDLAAFSYPMMWDVFASRPTRPFGDVLGRRLIP